MLLGELECEGARGGEVRCGGSLPVATMSMQRRSLSIALVKAPLSAPSTSCNSNSEAAISAEQRLHICVKHLRK